MVEIIRDEKVYDEICLFLNTIEKSKLYNLIPEDILAYFYERSKIDENLIINLDTYNFSDEARAIIAYLSYNYFFDEDEKNKVYDLFEHNEILLEKQKVEKYNPDDLFKKPNNKSSKKSEELLYGEKQFLINAKKKNIFQKIFSFFSKN